MFSIYLFNGLLMFFHVAIDYCPENKRDKDNDDRGDQTKKKMEIEFYLIVLYSAK